MLKQMIKILKRIYPATVKLFGHEHSWRWTKPVLPGHIVVGSISQCRCGTFNPAYRVHTELTGRTYVVTSTPVDPDPRVTWMDKAVWDDVVKGQDPARPERWSLIDRG